MHSEIVLDKEQLFKKIQSFENIQEIECPELNGFMKGGINGNVILKVKSATLDDHIQARELATNNMFLLKEVVDKIRQDKKIDIQKILKIVETKEPHSKTEFELQIFHRCVVEPTFDMEEARQLSEVMPTLINRVAKFALSISMR